MPRPPRADGAGAVYHALNRGNAREPIFHKEEDFAAFERVIGQGLEKFSVQLYSYQWMTNHWHMVLSPQVDGEMSRFLYWITMTHTARYHAHYHTTGEGHVYQGRYKSFPMEEDDGKRRKAISKKLGTRLPFRQRRMGREDREAFGIGVNPTLSRSPA